MKRYVELPYARSVSPLLMPASRPDGMHEIFSPLDLVSNFVCWHEQNVLQCFQQANDTQVCVCF